MLDAAMYVLGFPAVKRVNAHSYQRIGTRKNSGQFGKWDPETYTVEDSLFGTIEFHNGGILRLETSFALNIPEQSIMNVNFCGDLAGATLFPAQFIPIVRVRLTYCFSAKWPMTIVIIAAWKLL